MRVGSESNDAVALKDLSIFDHRVCQRWLPTPASSILFHPQRPHAPLTAMSKPVEYPIASSADPAAEKVEANSAVLSQVPAATSDGDDLTDIASVPPPSSSSPSTSARRCNCKNSRCLKLYCECFAAGSYCNALCKCCLNTTRHMSER